MAGMPLNIISSCARSPYFECTRERTRSYGEHQGRLTPVIFDREVSEEYWVLRKAAGLFDVPERPLEIAGKDSTRFLDRMFTRPVSTLRLNRGRYGLLCHNGGGIACDGVVFRLEEDRFWYVHADRDVFTWMSALSEGYEVTIRDPRSWVLQIQGPRSLEILADCCDGGRPAPFDYFHAARVGMGGQPLLVSRTGWTGELGFEIYNLDPEVDGPALWNHLLARGNRHGLEPCSTYAMNPRRIEAGILNYGTDMNWDTTPFDLGLGQFVDLDGHDFIGRDALIKGDKRSRFSGFKLLEGDAKWGARVLSEGEPVATIKALDHSPYLQCGVGYVLFDSADLAERNNLVVLDRQGRERDVALHDLPFYDAEKRIPRGLDVADL
jgi:aminomethyltransferase